MAEKERAEKESALAENEKNRSALANTVKELSAFGMDESKISAITGLSVDQIRSILS